MTLGRAAILVVALLAAGCTASVSPAASGSGIGATGGTSGSASTAASGASGTASSSSSSTGTSSSSSSGSTSSSSASSGSSSTSSSASSASSSSSSGSTGASPSGEPMPVGDLPGWHQIFADDFVTDAPLGSFPGTNGAPYSNWSAYPDGWHDTSGNGQYSPERTLSVANGVLTINVHTENGTHFVAAPEPMNGAGQTYGRYSVRFRATNTTNDYKTAWLLWPDSELWPTDGEIDYPEGNLASDFNAYAHYADPNGGQDAFSNLGTYTSWHTATTEWSAGLLNFYLDGALVGTSTHEVPHNSMHYVLQTETNLDGVTPSDTSVGTIEVDWVVIYAPQ